MPKKSILPNKPQQEDTVTIMLMREMIVNVVGSSTGKRYTFNGSGSTQDVDKMDVEKIMQQPLPPSCCGSFPTPFFQIIER